MARTSRVAATRAAACGRRAAAVADVRARLPASRRHSTTAAVSRAERRQPAEGRAGKWFGTEPRVLLLDEPTRGVDVGAKAEIYRLLEAAKDARPGDPGSSSETSELQLLCDRILVMSRGRIDGGSTGDEADEARIARCAMGHAG